MTMKTHTINGIRVRVEVLSNSGVPEMRCKATGRPAKVYRGSSLQCVRGGYLVPDTRHAAELYARS